MGAVGLVTFAAWWLLTVAGRGFFPSVFLLLAVLPLTVAALFLLNWVLPETPGQHHGVPG